MSTNTDLPPPSSAEPQQGPPARERLRSLRSVCVRALKRSRSKRDKQAAELAEASEGAHHQQMADAILAALAGLRRGMASCQITNPHTGLTETIVLNPALTPQENADMYYRKARKARRGLEVIRQNIAETDQQIERITSLIHDIEKLVADPAVTADEHARQADLTEEALRDIGVLPRRSPTPKPGRPEERIPYRHLTLDGWDIFVGRNDAQNDELSTRFARPWDIWMHVAGHPGSHLVIRRAKNTEWPPRNILQTAAAFAIWFSKAKHTSYAEVHVTERRFVRKRHGAPAGQVIVERFKTLRASPVSPQDYFKNAAPADEPDQWA